MVTTKKLRVTVDGKPFDVVVEIPAEPAVAPVMSAPVSGASVSSAASSVSAPAVTSSPAPAPSSSSAGAIVSPLSGLVAAIGVKLGQAVAEGEHVLTLEAMKMNTFVFAPKAGKIKEIHVDVGASVNENQILMVLE